MAPVPALPLLSLLPWDIPIKPVWLFSKLPRIRLEESYFIVTRSLGVLKTGLDNISSMHVKVVSWNSKHFSYLKYIPQELPTKMVAGSRRDIKCLINSSPLPGFTAGSAERH